MIQSSINSIFLYHWSASSFVSASSVYLRDLWYFLSLFTYITIFLTSIWSRSSWSSSSSILPAFCFVLSSTRSSNGSSSNRLIQRSKPNSSSIDPCVSLLNDAWCKSITCHGFTCMSAKFSSLLYINIIPNPREQKTFFFLKISGPFL